MMRLPIQARSSIRRLLHAAALALVAGEMPALPAAAAGCASPAATAYVSTDAALRAVRLDTCAGRLSVIGDVAQVAKPRWTVAHPTLPVLYAALDGGHVAAFKIDRSSAALAPLNDADASGSGTTYLALDTASQTLLTANFGAGSVSSIAVQSDGRLADRVSTIAETGSGPHRRQTSAHAHAVSIDPSGRYALVPDFGADRLFVYAFNRADRTLTATGRAWQSPAGSGPRRAVFGTDGRFVYVLNELTADIAVLRWDVAAGALNPVQTVPLSNADFTGTKSASEFALSRDGRFAYVANRGENTLQVYGVNRETGELALIQRLPSGGDAPWAFDLHPNGHWLLVANYRSNRLNLFSVDAATGLLADTGQSVGAPAPVSVLFTN